METPFIDHLTAIDYEHVYEPAEDSFLLLDALESDLLYLERLQPCICLEIGSGSGVIITALAKKLKTGFCLATDINRYACAVTKKTAQRNDAKVESVNCNLVDVMRSHSIDLLIFNPPYVVTTDEELENRSFPSCGEAGSKAQSNLAYSWAGGIHGRRVIDELLKRLDMILSPCGVFYLLVLRENKPDELIADLKQFGFEAIKFMERRIPGEYLYILKITRK